MDSSLTTQHRLFLKTRPHHIDTSVILEECVRGRGRWRLDHWLEATYLLKASRMRDSMSLCKLCEQTGCHTMTVAESLQPDTCERNKQQKDKHGCNMCSSRSSTLILALPTHPNSTPKRPAGGGWKLVWLIGHTWIIHKDSPCGRRTGFLISNTARETGDTCRHLGPLFLFFFLV